MTRVSARVLLAALRMATAPATVSVTWPKVRDPRAVRLAGSWLTVDTPTMQVRVDHPDLHLPTGSVDYDALAMVAERSGRGSLWFGEPSVDGLPVSRRDASWVVPWVTGWVSSWVDAVDGPAAVIPVAALAAARTVIPESCSFEVLEYAHVRIGGSVDVTGSDRALIVRATTIAGDDSTPGVLLLPAELIDQVLALRGVTRLTVAAATVRRGHGIEPAIHATATLGTGVVVDIYASTISRTYPHLDARIDQCEPDTPGTWTATTTARTLTRACRALASTVSPHGLVQLRSDGRLEDHATYLATANVSRTVPDTATSVPVTLGLLTRIAGALTGAVTVTGRRAGDPIHLRDTAGVHALLASVRPSAPESHERRP